MRNRTPFPSVTSMHYAVAHAAIHGLKVTREEMPTFIARCEVSHGELVWRQVRARDMEDAISRLYNVPVPPRDIVEIRKLKACGV